MTNIKDHKWSSRWIAEAWGDEDGNLVFDVRLSDDYQAINKQDAIAVAEHFGLLKDTGDVRIRNFIISLISEYEAGACNFNDFVNSLMRGFVITDNNCFSEKEVISMAENLGMECYKKSNDFTHSAGRSNY